METAIKKIQTSLPEGIDAALVISPVARQYLTGFPSEDGWVAITRDDAVFFEDSRYIEAAEAQVTSCRCVLQGKIYEQLGEFFGAAGAKRVAIEGGFVTLAGFENLKAKLPGFELTGEFLTDAISSMRRIKTREQVEMMTTAQRIAEKALDHILGFIKPGVTEKQVQLELDFYMLSHGAEALSFETIAVSGANTSKPHGVPSGKKIEKGDFVTLDFGATFNGWHSDMTRTVAVGSVSEKQREVYNIVLAAQRAGLSALTAGISGRDTDKAARDVIENAGYGKYFGHGTGHGVGLEIHESPSSSPASTDVFDAGVVVTVEPGIYIPGEFGVRIEDMAVVCRDGCIDLTEASRDLIIL